MSNIFSTLEDFTLLLSRQEPPLPLPHSEVYHCRLVLSATKRHANGKLVCIFKICLLLFIIIVRFIFAAYSSLFFSNTELAPLFELGLVVVTHSAGDGHI